MAPSYPRDSIELRRAAIKMVEVTKIIKAGGTGKLVKEARTRSKVRVKLKARRIRDSLRVILAFTVGN